MKKIILILVFTIFTANFTGCTYEHEKEPVKYIAEQIENPLTGHAVLKYTRLLNKNKRLMSLDHPVMRKEETKPASSLLSYRTFMDSTGYFTSFKDKPVRVAALFSSYAQVWKLAGGTLTATVEESVTRNIVAENEAVIVGQGSGKQINLEALLLTNPDLVILTADYSGQVELAEVLRRHDIPTLVFRTDSFLDYLTMLSCFTKILDTDQAYEQYGSKILDRIDAIKEITKASECKENVLLLRAYSYGAKVKGTNFFVGQMINDLNVHNIIDNYNYPLDTLSAEELMNSEITCILIAVMGTEQEAAKRYVEDTLFQQPGYRSLAAVKNHNYFFLPKELFTYKPNQRWDEAYSYLAGLLYPELFTTNQEAEVILP